MSPADENETLSSFSAVCDPEGAGPDDSFPDPLALLLSDLFDPLAFLHDVYGLQTAKQLYDWSVGQPHNERTLWRVHTVWWKYHVYQVSDLSEILLTWYHERLSPDSSCSFGTFYDYLADWITQTRAHWSEYGEIITSLQEHLASRWSEDAGESGL